MSNLIIYQIKHTKVHKPNITVIDVIQYSVKGWILWNAPYPEKSLTHRIQPSGLQCDLLVANSALQLCRELLKHFEYPCSGSKKSA